MTNLNKDHGQITHLLLIQHLLLQFFQQLTLQVNLVILRSGRGQRPKQKLSIWSFRVGQRKRIRPVITSSDSLL